METLERPELSQDEAKKLRAILDNAEVKINEELNRSSDTTWFSCLRTVASVFSGTLELDKMKKLIDPFVYSEIMDKMKKFDKDLIEIAGIYKDERVPPEEVRSAALEAFREIL
jgi:predicted nucleotidyltransferase